MEVEIDATGKSYTSQCVNYLISEYMKNKNPIKKEDLMKTILKGRVNGKNYDKVMEDVSNSLKNVFGFSISNIKEDGKQFILVNNIEKLCIPETSYSSSALLKYRVLLKPIIISLVMLRTPISEGQMWKLMEKLSSEFNLDMDQVKTVVKKDFVKDQYLVYKATDDTTVQFDPERTSFWFSMGPRAIAECDQKMALQRVSEMKIDTRNSPQKLLGDIISLYEKNTCLWEIKSPKYNDKNKRNNA